MRYFWDLFVILGMFLGRRQSKEYRTIRQSTEMSRQSASNSDLMFSLKWTCRKNSQVNERNTLLYSQPASTSSSKSKYDNARQNFSRKAIPKVASATIYTKSSRRSSSIILEWVINILITLISCFKAAFSLIISLRDIPSPFALYPVSV